MLSKFFADLRRQWAGVLALFLVLTGGTAWAVDEWTGANIQDGTLTNVDYKNNDIRSADVKNGQLTGLDIKNESVEGGSAIDPGDIAADSVTGADVADQSGVDTCTHGSVRFGELCVGVANVDKTWRDAHELCASLELRLPSLGEAMSLGWNHDLPNVGDSEFFWTEEFWDAEAPLEERVWTVPDDPEQVGLGRDAPTSTLETVCVTTPTN